MRYLLVILLAVVSLGYMVNKPETIRQGKKDDQAWAKEINQAYDLKALHHFLCGQIKANPWVDGVDLRRVKITKKSTIAGRKIHSGEWTLNLPDPKNSEFTITWIDKDKSSDNRSAEIWNSITFICQRKTKADFMILSVKRADNIAIVLFD